MSIIKDFHPPFKIGVRFQVRETVLTSIIYHTLSLIKVKEKRENKNANKEKTLNL